MVATTMTTSARILFHPTLLARRAAEIARTQGASRLEQDACGRPFIRAADPLATAANDPLARPMRLAWLIRLMHALGREAGPRVGKPVGRGGEGNPHPPSPARGRGGDQ